MSFTVSIQLANTANPPNCSVSILNLGVWSRDYIGSSFCVFVCVWRYTKSLTLRDASTLSYVEFVFELQKGYVSIRSKDMQPVYTSIYAVSSTRKYFQEVVRRRVWVTAVG